METVLPKPATLSAMETSHCGQITLSVIETASSGPLELSAMETVLPKAVKLSYGDVSRWTFYTLAMEAVSPGP